MHKPSTAFCYNQKGQRQHLDENNTQQEHIRMGFSLSLECARNIFSRFNWHRGDFPEQISSFLNNKI